jgi:hypothetical protein
MRKHSPLLLVLVLALVLTGCGSEAVRDAYTATGDSSEPDDLEKTSTFRADDDLNVVVTLGTHNYEVPIYAIFRAPTGAAYATDVLEADKTVGKVLLGLDWEGQGTLTWPTGTWTVEIYVEDAREETLSFDVEPIPIEELPADG